MDGGNCVLQDEHRLQPRYRVEWTLGQARRAQGQRDGLNFHVRVDRDSGWDEMDGGNCVLWGEHRLQPR